MTNAEARELIAKLLAGFPNQQMDDANVARYCEALTPFNAADRAAVVQYVDTRRMTFLPTVPELVGIATDVTVDRIKHERESRDNRVVEAFKLTSGMTDEDASQRAEGIKAVIRGNLKDVNGAKAANKGVLPDGWQRTEPETETLDPTRCPVCNGRDPVCHVCDGRGIVCPTCRGSRILRRNRQSSERPLYIGCPDCTDWNRQTEHHWTDGNYPVYQRDYDRERHTIHAARSGRRAA